MSQQVRESQKAPQTRGKGQAVGENTSPLTGKPPPWKENVVSLVGKEGYEED
jgi:hypothetical protein